MGLLFLRIFSFDFRAFTMVNREKAREAQAGCCKGCGQRKSNKEGEQEKCEKGEENARQDDQKQEDCCRVLESQTESFKEYTREPCQKLLLTQPSSLNMQSPSF